MVEIETYANDNHIEIVGDMPIYVAEDSKAICGQIHISLRQMLTVRRLASQDAHQMNFLQLVSFGVNPIYDWEAMDKDGYKWWIERLRESFKIYDIVRIDHFRGFESYWEIPAGSDTAAPGEWVKGPATSFLQPLRKSLVS